MPDLTSAEFLGYRKYAPSSNVLVFLDLSVGMSLNPLAQEGLYYFSHCHYEHWSDHVPRKPSNPVDKYVGTRVRMCRIMMEMSQEKLGDALGLTFQQVQKYEKGTNRIGASRLHKIADVLNVPVAFFFEGCPGTLQGSDRRSEEPTPNFISDFLASTDGISLTKAFVSIGDKKLRRSIVELVEQIAARRDDG